MTYAVPVPSAAEFHPANVYPSRVGAAGTWNVPPDEQVRSSTSVPPCSSNVTGTGGISGSGVVIPASAACVDVSAVTVKPPIDVAVAPAVTGTSESVSVVPPSTV